MNTTYRKSIIGAVKVVIALGLLVWVLRQVHWHDYVIAKADGKAYAVQPGQAGSPGVLRVTEGLLWWRTESVMDLAELLPIPGSRDVIRKGFASTVSQVRPLPLATAVGGFVLSWLIISLRWRLLLGVQDIRIGVWEAVRMTFLGQFFNLVVPGLVGGDLVKAYYVSRHTPHKAATLVSVVVDRMMGLAELTFLAAVMAGVAAMTGLASREELALPVRLLPIVVLALAAVLIFVLSSRFRRLLHLEVFYQRLPIAHHIVAAGHAAGLYARRPGKLIEAFLMTVGAQVIWIGSIYLIAVSLSLPTPWYRFYLYIPLIYIISAVPLTPGGVGLLEKMYAVFFVSGATTASMVLAVALLARLAPILCSLPGALVAIRGPRLPKAEQIQAELVSD